MPTSLAETQLSGQSNLSWWRWLVSETRAPGIGRGHRASRSSSGALRRPPRVSQHGEWVVGGRAPAKASTGDMGPFWKLEQMNEVPEEERRAEVAKGLGHFPHELPPFHSNTL